MGAILDVDLTSGSHRVRELTQDMADKWLGGTGLGAHLLWEEGTYRADPLGTDNVMVWAPGPFAGTAVPLSNRFGVCARSPLTGVWGEAECGGHWANDLKKAGFDALVIRGKAPKPVYLWITDGNVQLRDAEHLWGKDTFETHDTVREEVGSAGRRGQEPGVACIGPAGEKLVRYAAIMVDGKDGRAIGRAGLGAVMGSKNLKAVAVRGTQAISRTCAKRSFPPQKASARWAPPAASRRTTRWATGPLKTGSRTTGPKRPTRSRAPR